MRWSGLLAVKEMPEQYQAGQCHQPDNAQCKGPPQPVPFDVLEMDFVITKHDQRRLGAVMGTRVVSQQ